MKRLLILITVFCIAISGAFGDIPPLKAAKDAPKYVAGELVVVVPSNARNAAVAANNLLETWGYVAGKREVTFTKMSLKLYKPKQRGAEKSVQDAIRLFNGPMARNAGGAKLLPNYLFRINGDPCFNRKDIYKDRDGIAHNIFLQWDMKNPGEFGGVPGADLKVTDAWKLLPKNNDPIIVAVVDTGVDTEHPGLKNRIHTKNGKVVGKDFTAWWGDGSYLDDHGHGSHCAGSIAAGYDDNEGMTGSSGPTNVKIIPIKALGKDGSGDLLSISEAMKWAGKQNADVLSMSFGAVPLFPEQEPILKEVFDGILADPVLKNTIPVAAAGNNGEDIHAFPAFCNGAIAIAASDHQDKKASFSNFGNWVDVAAPGVNILSVRGKHKGKFLDMYRDAGFDKAEFAIGNKSKSPYDSRGYYIASGTSMACPNAAGVVAMLLAVNPKLKGNTDAIRKILMETSDKKGTFGIKSDGGRINALNALKAAMAK